MISVLVALVLGAVVGLAALPAIVWWDLRKLKRLQPVPVRSERRAR